MGIAELKEQQKQLIIHAKLFFYGDAAAPEISNAVAKDIADHWNEPQASISLKGNLYFVIFNIEGQHAPALQPQDVYENDNALYNYFRIEEYAEGNISFVDGIGSNTGYFKLDNLLNNSTTAAHEFGHTIGLQHPAELDIRGTGTPGIMYPRGTIVDAVYQYSPVAKPLEPGGTMNPFTRKVLQEDIDNLNLHRLAYNRNGVAVIGNFTNIWHQQHRH